MAIIQAFFAALARFAGKILNTLFGWATTTLFGNVPENKQILLSLMSLGSVVWIALVIGVIWPDAGVFLLSVVTLPEWVQDRWVRMAMVAAALLLPAGIVAEQLAFSPSYMTWTKEANELEDRLGAIWDRVKAKDAVQGQADLAQQLEQLEHDLRSAKISSEEWEILLREKLLVERAILQVAAGLVDQAREPAEMDAKKLGTGAVLSSAPTPGEMLLRRALVVIGAVLGLWIVSRKSS